MKDACGRGGREEVDRLKEREMKIEIVRETKRGRPKEEAKDERGENEEDEKESKHHME